MLSRVIYNREVTDDGDYVVGADIKLGKSFVVKEDALHFTVGNRKISFINFSCNGRDIHVEFEHDESLSTLTFDTKAFVNHFALPQINIKIDDLSEDLKRFLITFNGPNMVSDFSSGIYQQDAGQFSYYQYSTGTNATKRPLVVFLHGSGERGFGDELPLIGNDVPKTIHDYIKTHEDAVLLVPQASWSKELNGWFRPEIRGALLGLIHAVIDDENIDSSRVYLAGLSNGGAATWHFAEQYPSLFAAIVPCCGYIFNDNKSFVQGPGKGRYMEPEKKEAERLSNTPIWAFHAEDDPTVDVRGTREAIAAVKAQGNQNVRMTIYSPGSVSPNPHASWKLAYNDKNLLPWLFAQHR
ncbi:phospholipase [Lacticaseibacillus paracasei]|uniref:carboxylesterase family protein n=1 Tax=Lacticaseibacillus paracasei TaxID=1597 RepID=UPI000A1DD543|nr:PHB depolymerase family esterase [Lacticaseibacillus paracasei]OSP84435.1 phospholipase [Lacticaseibacillus paracasei]